MDAATAVLEQRVEALETEGKRLRGQFEHFKMVTYILALEAGKDWKEVCDRARRRMEARQRVLLQRAEDAKTEARGDG